MVKRALLRKHIDNLLLEKPMTVKELKYKINSITRNGASSHTIGMILSTNPKYKKVGTERVLYCLSYKTNIIQWGLRESENIN